MILQVILDVDLSTPPPTPPHSWGVVSPFIEEGGTGGMVIS
jgi:hypothetical protein